MAANLMAYFYYSSNPFIIIYNVFKILEWRIDKISECFKARTWSIYKFSRKTFNNDKT